jgi:hypothetical protein
MSNRAPPPEPTTRTVSGSEDEVDVPVAQAASNTQETIVTTRIGTPENGPPGRCIRGRALSSLSSDAHFNLDT